MTTAHHTICQCVCVCVCVLCVCVVCVCVCVCVCECVSHPSQLVLTHNVLLSSESGSSVANLQKDQDKCAIGPESSESAQLQLEW